MENGKLVSESGPQVQCGVIAGRFPNKKLHWDSEKAQFEEEEANQYLDGVYRKF